MPVSMKSLGIDRLSVEERLDLLEEIWDSIGEDLPLSESHKATLDARLAAHEADPGKVVAWEEVKARLEASLGE